MNEKKKYDLWLARVQGIGPAKIHLIYGVCDSAEECWHFSEKELRMIYGLEDSDVRNILESRHAYDLDMEYEKLKESGIQMVGPNDPEFPPALREIKNPPYWLFVRGKLPDLCRMSVAVVGARTCTDYGRAMAKLVGQVLSEAGVQVISGMARGIDSYAHEGALLAGGDTYAVLGCGVNVCYPSDSRKIFREIPKKGGLISEYPPEDQPRAGNFPMRNRIISGLSRAVVVVEARKKSGSLITADLALSQGRDVYAVPGKITDPLSSGTNRLIAQGAFPVISMADMLKDMELSGISMKPKEKEEAKSLPKTEQRVYRKLSEEAVGLEELVKKTKLAIPVLTEALVKLQNQGLIEESFKNWYRVVI